MKVWIIGNLDYGDNGWSIAGVFSSEEIAKKWAEENPTTFGYYDEPEEYEVIDAISTI